MVFISHVLVFLPIRHDSASPTLKINESCKCEIFFPISPPFSPLCLVPPGLRATYLQLLLTLAKKAALGTRWLRDTHRHRLVRAVSFSRVFSERSLSPARPPFCFGDYALNRGRPRRGQRERPLRPRGPPVLSHPKPPRYSRGEEETSLFSPGSRPNGRFAPLAAGCQRPRHPPPEGDASVTAERGRRAPSRPHGGGAAGVRGALNRDTRSASS